MCAVGGSFSRMDNGNMQILAGAFGKLDLVNVAANCQQRKAMMLAWDMFRAFRLFAAAMGRLVRKSKSLEV